MNLDRLPESTTHGTLGLSVTMRLNRSDRGRSGQVLSSAVTGLVRHKKVTNSTRSLLGNGFVTDTADSQRCRDRPKPLVFFRGGIFLRNLFALTVFGQTGELFSDSFPIGAASRSPHFERFAPPYSGMET